MRLPTALFSALFFLPASAALAQSPGQTPVQAPGKAPGFVVDYLMGQAQAQERLDARPDAPPALKFRVEDGFLKLPADINMGEVVGVTLNAAGEIFVVNRGARSLLKFDHNGNFLRSVGDAMPIFEGPHSARIDRDDNLWYIDAGNNLVVRFDKNLHSSMVLGRRPESWTWKTHVIEHAIPARDNFYQPTDVVTAPDGSIFVSDGYGNSRIAKFSKEGIFIKDWGVRGTGPSEFNTPHNMVLDAQNNLYVADRQNGRIQVFDLDGKYQREFRVGGNPWSLCLTPGPNQVMFVGSVGKIFKVGLDGKVLGTIGKYGKVPGMMDWVHGVACPDEKTLYAAQELSWRLDKISLE